MANFAFATAMQRFARAQINWETITARALLVNEVEGHYTPDAFADEYVSDIPAGDRIAISNPLTDLAVDLDGVLRAGTGTFFESVAAGPDRFGSAVVIYAEVGGESTSYLILHLSEMSGLPMEPNGTNFDIVWNTGPDGIYRI